ERTLHFLDFTRAATAGTGHRLSFRCRARTRTAITQHRSINGHGLAHTGVGFLQRNGRAQQCIIAWLYARARTTSTAATAAEEFSEDITQTASAAAAATAASAAPAPPPAADANEHITPTASADPAAQSAAAGPLLHRIRAHIHYPTLLRIQQTLLR